MRYATKTCKDNSIALINGIYGYNDENINSTDWGFQQ